MIAMSFEVTVGDFELAPTLEVPSGITVLFGPSGSGKTLTLEAVAGLLRPDVVTVAGRVPVVALGENLGHLGADARVVVAG